MKYVDEFRDGELAGTLATKIRSEALPDRTYHLMEFCGGHTHAIFRYGVQDLMPDTVKFVHGPGCPVCVLPVRRLDDAVELAERHGVILCSYGDMMRVPGTKQRSLIRAKVALLGSAADGRARALAHVGLAARYLQPVGSPGLVITHGLSGSGKSHTARRLANGPGFLHLRSDIERRRLGGLAPAAASGSELGDGIYTATHTRATYARLVELARTALSAGFSVIVDAVFLTREQRRPFGALARKPGVPFHVLGCSAPRPVLEQRIEARRRSGDDPSEATVEVLAAQCDAVEALDDDEMAVLIAPGELDDARVLARLGRARPGPL